MEIKQLEKELRMCIYSKGIETDVDARTTATMLFDEEIEQASKSCASITIEHMKGFADWVSKDWNISNGIGWWHPHDSLEDISTEQLIELYFNSLKEK